MKSKVQGRTMTKKIVDLMTFKIEKSLKDNGFTLKKDDTSIVKLLIKLNNTEEVKQ